MMTELRVASLSVLRVLALFSAAALAMATAESGHAQSLLPPGTGVGNVVPSGTAISADDQPYRGFIGQSDR